MIDAPVSEYSDLLRSLYHSYRYASIDGNDFKNSKRVAGTEDLHATYFALNILLTRAPTENQLRSLEEELDRIFTKDLQIRIVPVTKDKYSFFFIPEETEMVGYFMRLNLETVAARARLMQGALGAKIPDCRLRPQHNCVKEIAHR